MVDVEFSPEAVRLRLSPTEFRFVRSALEHVINGGVIEREFSLLMMNERSDAEEILARLNQLERAAEEAGSHW